METHADVCLHHSNGFIDCHRIYLNALQKDSPNIYDSLREDVRRAYTKQVCDFYKQDESAQPNFNNDGSCSLTYNNVRVRLYDFGKWEREYTPRS